MDNYEQIGIKIMNTKLKGMKKNQQTKIDKNSEIVENVNENIVQMTEEFRKSLPPMPQSVIDNSISFEDFEKEHPWNDTI